jgi:hypothetical protein
VQVEKGVTELWWEMRDRLLTMKETNASETMGALLYDWNQWQKSILLEVQNLKKLDNEWASSTAKLAMSIHF